MQCPLGETGQGLCIRSAGDFSSSTLGDTLSAEAICSTMRTDGWILPVSMRER